MIIPDGDRDRVIGQPATPVDATATSASTSWCAAAARRPLTWTDEMLRNRFMVVSGALTGVTLSIQAPSSPPASMREAQRQIPPGVRLVRG